MASARTGIAHQPYGQTTIEYLPLEEVRVKAWVVDVSSRIVLSQTFYNASDKPTGRAKYVFPLPANAAVCAFELELDDGSVIVGKIKEKEEAARTFTRAVDQGSTAALVERVTDDIFTISIGCIPAATKVKAHLTFVMDLLDEALTDHIRLQLPMYIAERYGTPPLEMQNTSTAGSRTRLHISVDVQTSEVIYGIRSPTHHITLQRYKELSGRKSQRRISAIWKSSEFLTSDFVLTIHAEGLDRPRCFAEVFSATEAGVGEGSTIAMQLTLIPKFLTPKIPSQEYIFILDRSGSMQNDPIETAKRTLIMLLRLLPSTQTTFNIFSFGSVVTSLWSNSCMLNPASLLQATTDVAGMGADLGGTEIPKALWAAFNSRGLDRPTVVFLLTDGRIYERDQPDQIISNAIQSSPPHAPVRLFVLGIGDNVSLDMCSRLARHGNGEALFAQSAEDILAKCACILNAARSKNIESINVDWGHSSPVVGLLSPTTPVLPAGIPALEPPPLVQQAPHSMTKIFSGIRFTVFAIIALQNVPTSIRLITKSDGIFEPQELTVRVTKVKPFHEVEHSTIPIVHTLAARRLIMELDDRVGPLPTPAAGGALLVSADDLRMAGIVRLGLTYQLLSKYTSFVTVREGEQRRNGGHRRGNMTWATSRLARTDLDTQDDSTIEEPTLLDNLISGISSLITSVFGFPRNPMALASAANANISSRPRHQPGFPGAYNEFDSDTSQSRGRTPRRTPSSPRRRSPPSDHSTDTFSSLSSLEGSSCSTCWTPSRSPSPFPQLHDPILRAPSPQFRVDSGTQGLGPTNVGSGPGASRSRPSKRHPISPEVYDLFRQMNVDGSFIITPLLSRLVGDAILSKADELGIDKKVWPTVVVVAYIKTQLQSEPDLLDLMSEKAKEFVNGSEWSRSDGAKGFDEMVREAVAELSP